MPNCTPVDIHGQVALYAEGASGGCRVYAPVPTVGFGCGIWDLIWLGSRHTLPWPHRCRHNCLSTSHHRARVLLRVSHPLARLSGASRVSIRWADSRV